MGNYHNRTVYDCLSLKIYTKILAISVISFLLLGNISGHMKPSPVYSSKEEVYWAQTPDADFPTTAISSTPLSSESQQTIKITVGNPVPTVSSKMSSLAFSTAAPEVISLSVPKETKTINDQILSFDPILLSSTNSYISPTSSSYFNSNPAKETYLNYSLQDTETEFNPTFDETATNTFTSHSLQLQSNVPISPTRSSENAELVQLTSSYSQPFTNIQSTPILKQPQLDMKETFEHAAKSEILASTPPNWQMTEASPATVVQGAMTWVTSQPSSSSQLQSEFHMPAGTVAGIVVASIAFVGLIAAALGCLALKKFRSNNAKTYENTYSSDTFSYLDNLQVSYINHHVELPKESSDEMFSLDNDSFLNSLEAMTMENYWAEDSKSTKV